MKTNNQLDAKLQQAVLAGRLLPGMTFTQKVWAYCARIPQGKVATYGQLAAIAGKPGAARAVGSAMRCNPLAPGVPCHRVVASNGALTGYSAGTSAVAGLVKKRLLLKNEGVSVLPDDRVPLTRFQWQPKATR